jgi:hypothetical protein
MPTDAVNPLGSQVGTRESFGVPGCLGTPKDSRDLTRRNIDIYTR